MVGSHLFCTGCGKKNNADAVFCTFCGAEKQSLSGSIDVSDLKSNSPDINDPDHISPVVERYDYGIRTDERHDPGLDRASEHALIIKRTYIKAITTVCAVLFLISLVLIVIPLIRDSNDTSSASGSFSESESDESETGSENETDAVMVLTPETDEPEGAAEEETEPENETDDDIEEDREAIPDIIETPSEYDLEHLFSEINNTRVGVRLTMSWIGEPNAGKETIFFRDRGNSQWYVRRLDGITTDTTTPEFAFDGHKITIRFPELRIRRVYHLYPDGSGYFTHNPTTGGNEDLLWEYTIN